MIDRPRVNPRVAEIPASMIREIAAKKRHDSIDLGLGEPSLAPTARFLEAAMRDTLAIGLRYSANAGMPELREAISQHYRYPGMDRLENVCVTTGSQEAMYVALKTLLDPDRDELLVVEPCFPSYAKMAKLDGVAVRSVEMLEEEDFSFDARRILDAVGEHTRAIVICSPNNPTARVLDRTQASILYAGLQAREGEPIWLIHDEIYREQCFVGTAAEIAAEYPWTIATNSLSKSNALTGLRLGWLIGPSAFIENAIKCHAWVTSCADTFAQRVALHIFSTSGGITEHTAWYKKHRIGVVSALEGSALRFILPEGAFYACVRLPEGRRSLPSALELLDRENVVAIPGAAFGANFDGWLRLSWVAPVPIVREGIERIARYIST
ncbi:MAG TPA: pyridoxal phosphate-dependent aminotransferase [Candidatus Dormibacteraeota bacterium]|nr:pyridoxal phosphate-dependent aminotransferase [Candidatus Dormibacteraeota bacterium]